MSNTSKCTDTEESSCNHLPFCGEASDSSHANPLSTEILAPARNNSRFQCGRQSNTKHQRNSFPRSDSPSPNGEQNSRSPTNPEHSKPLGDVLPGRDSSLRAATCGPKEGSPFLEATAESSHERSSWPLRKAPDHLPLRRAHSVFRQN